jgi:glycosyltransferase involved in cell wall biosynthesis
MMRITVAIPSIRPEHLAGAIRSICDQSWAEWRLIVIGQGPNPGMARVVSQFSAKDPRVSYLHLDRMGCSVARNSALQVADTDILAFTDDDCEADRNWLATLAECFQADDQLGLAGGSLLAPGSVKGPLSVCPELRVPEAVYDPARDRGHAPEGFDFIGGNFALRRSIVTPRVGVFDECLGPGARYGACDDTDYKLRLEAAGIRMRCTPRAIVKHTHGRRSGIKATFALSKSYALGQGAVAAKLTLGGDPRGSEWLANVWTDCVRTFRPDRIYRAPKALLRLYFVRQAYRDCLQTHQYDAGSSVLQPKAA